MYSDEAKQYFIDCGNVYDNQELINIYKSLATKYLDQITPKNVLEIGYELGSSLAYYASNGFKVTGFDIEAFNKVQFVKRFCKEPYFENICLKTGNLAVDTLPIGKFGLICVENVFHFFTLKEAQKIAKKVSKQVALNGFIAISNHHTTHRYNDGDEKEYKHFYSENDLSNLFPAEKFMIVEYHIETYPEEAKKTTQYINFLRQFDVSETEIYEITNALHTTIYCLYRRIA